MAKDFTFTPVPESVIKNMFEKALFAAKEQILNDCNMYVRVDQGILRDTSRTEEGNMSIELVWDTPYAKRVYYTGTPSKDVNPNASLEWAEKAAAKYKNDWGKIIEKGMNKE